MDLGQEKVPTIAIVLLETCLMSPKIVDGFYRTIPPSKAKMLKSKTTRKAVLRGEQVLEDARRLARKLGVLERPEAAGLLGWSDIRVISILCGLPGVFEKREWSGMDDISQDRFSDHSWD